MKKNSDKNCNMYLDIFLPKYKVAIEYDGQHHFTPVFNKDDDSVVERRQRLDSIKDSLCKKNNIKLIRYNYTETFTRTNFFDKLKFMV